MRAKRSQSGQAIVEYVLLLVLVVGFTRIIFRYLPDVIRTLETSFTERYTASYQYGDMTVRGGENGYERHPRAPGQGNFRMFRRLR
jgi:hypothetical protein